MRSLPLFGFMATMLLMAGVYPWGGGAWAQTSVISPFSGKPVPRFETLRYGQVHGRTGPGLDHSVAWMYERKGLPMLILKESHDWRRVRDPDGDEVWMHKKMLSSQVGIFTLSEIPLYGSPTLDEEAVSALAPRVLADVLQTHETWLKVEAQGHQGWVQANRLWGLNPDIYSK